MARINSPVEVALREDVDVRPGRKSTLHRVSDFVPITTDVHEEIEIEAALAYAQSRASHGSVHYASRGHGSDLGMALDGNDGVELVEADEEYGAELGDLSLQDAIDAGIEPLDGIRVVRSHHRLMSRIDATDPRILSDYGRSRLGQY